MEPTIRASIGTMAFTFEEKAYEILSDYIELLKKQLKAEDSAEETIRDIEYRLSELLQMRKGNNSRITVNQEDVIAILKIMGDPEDLGISHENNEEQRYSEYRATSQKEKTSKRLFRDKDTGLIGGVCSGLSHYLSVDVVLIRFIALIPLIAMLISIYFRFPIFFSIVFIEIILYIMSWIIIPKANSFEQKAMMTGANKPIALNQSKSSRKYRGSGFRQLLKALYKTILILLMTILVIIGVCMIVAFFWMNFDNTVLYIDNYISLFGLGAIQVKTSAFLIFIIPTIGLLALCYKLYTKSPFNNSNLVLFLLGLGLWVGAAAYLGSKALNYTARFNREAEVVENINLNKSYDTIYVTLGDEYQYASQQPQVPQVLYKKDSYSNKNDVCVIEDIRVIYDETIDDFVISYKKKSAGIDKAKARSNVRNWASNYIVQDSIITLNPKWHNADNPWDFTNSKLTIRVPENKEVMILGYLEDVAYIQ